MNLLSEEIDKIDRQILNILQEDGRMAFAEIARKIGVNEATIRFRVKKLVDKQVIIQFSALLNPRKIGLSITGVIMAKVNPKTLNKTFKELKNLPELLHIFQCTGKYDFLAVANVEDMEHLEQLKKLTRPGGQIVLETLILEGESEKILSPEGRYARMRNVHAIPTLTVLYDWLEQAGLQHVQLLDVSKTTTGEQRSTDWMTFESLQECLDRENPSVTVEGHPAPIRAALLVQK